MIIVKANHGKFVNWDVIMFSQLVKKLIKWEKCQKNMIEGMAKREPKQDVCHFAIMLEIIFLKWFPPIGAQPQEEKKQIKPQEDKKEKKSLKETFIKNKRTLNPSHISPKKEKQT